jgi:hypothetical protein
MPEQVAAIIICVVAIAIAAGIVLYFGRPEKKRLPVPSQPRFAVTTHNDENGLPIIVFETDDPQQAERARTWFRGDVIERDVF